MNCNHIESWQDQGMAHPPCEKCIEESLEEDNCSYCIENIGKPVPRHEASSSCESGKRNHCTCDICF